LQVRRIHRRREHVRVVVLRNVDRAERLQVLGGELRVEQREAFFSQPIDQMHEADLRRVRAPENMLSPKNAEPSETPYKAADQLDRRPTLRRYGHGPCGAASNRAI
jgi:hypothetical protein